LLQQEDRPYDFDCNEGCLGLGQAIDKLKVIATPLATLAPTAPPTITGINDVANATTNTFNGFV
jgi:hypothetical protein